MDIVSTTVLRDNLATTLNEVNKNKDYLLVAKKGKLVSALVNLDFFEDLLAMSSKEYLNSIKQARRDYDQKSLYSIDEAFGEIE